MRSSSALELIDVVREFDEMEVKRFGTSKLIYLLRAPQQARDLIRRSIEAGVSQHEIKKILKAVRVQYGTVGVKRVTGRKVVGGLVHNTSLDKSRPVKMKCTFVTKATFGGEDPRQAKRIVDSPVAELALTDQVTLRVALSRDKDGNIIGRMIFKRDQP